MSGRYTTGRNTSPSCATSPMRGRASCSTMPAAGRRPGCWRCR
jgi:hypothetical protein